MPTTAARRRRGVIADTPGTGGGGGGGGVPGFTMSSTTTSEGNPNDQSVLPEQSGLILSRKNTSGGDVWWAHNDSGNPAEVIAYKAGAVDATLAKYALASLTQGDYEEIDTYSISGTHYLYVFNFGSSKTNPAEILRVVEPTVSFSQSYTTGTIASGDIETFTFTRPVSDMEAAFIDPITGDAFLFQKVGGATRPQNANVYRVPSSQFVNGGGSLTLTLITSILSMNQTSNNGGFTGAAISADGKHFVVHNYEEVWGWKRDVDAGETVSSVLTGNTTGPYYVHNPTTWGSECIAWNSTKTRLYGRAEGTGSGHKYITVTYV